MMVELRKVIVKYLESLHPEVYFQEASKQAQYPYLVYNVETNPDGENYELVMLEIDGWDLSSNGDSNRVEELMNKVNGDGSVINPTGLDKRTLTSENLVVTFYLDMKLPPLPDDDKKIQRRKYTYQARLFGRS